MTIDDDLLERAATLLDARIGLKSDLSMRPRLARALRGPANAQRLVPSVLVASLDASGGLLDAVVDRITVQETAFFRHPEQFDAIVTLLEPGEPLQAWSAACANGQEAYSLAMIVEERQWGGSVLATDITPAAVERTGSARYNAREMGGVSDARRRQHFTRDHGEYVIRPELLRRVTVRRHNLLDPIPIEVGQCRFVFCRNVLIYFGAAHASRLLDRLAEAMSRDAYLFVGGAETLWQVTDRFEPVPIPGGFAYRPRSRTARATPTVTRERSPLLAPVFPVAPNVPSRQRVARPRVAAAASAAQQTGPLARDGEALLNAGDAAGAVAAFRRWAYDAPDDPLAHFHLATALSSAEDDTASKRAFRSARAALDRCDTTQLDVALEGFGVDELRRLIDARVAQET